MPETGEAVPHELGTTGVDPAAPLVVVSADTHIGPRLKEDLRDYCPHPYLSEYDEFVKAYEPQMNPAAIRKMFVPEELEADLGEVEADESGSFVPLNNTAGHHDMATRIKDMDRDGIAAEVIYHGSQNAQCFPFLKTDGGTFNAMVFSPVGTPHELELAAVGQRMYNQWLADQCSIEPERHVGLAHLPMWDCDRAVEELEWANDAGLKGVNFPSPKLGIAPYDELEWEPFWATCAERGMVLSTHAGSDIETVSRARPHSLIVLDMHGPHDKILPRLVFSGVFARHPNLKFAITELQVPPGRWWAQTAMYYDELWEANYDLLRSQVPDPPSRYFERNIFHGNSLLFLDPGQVDLAIAGGYAGNIMWGSDYPHGEGPYRVPIDDVAETRTVLALRHALAGQSPAIARQIAGATAMDVYGLDHIKLASVAARIGAISAARATTRLDEVPPDWKQLARNTLPFPEYHRAMEGV